MRSRCVSISIIMSRISTILGVAVPLEAPLHPSLAFLTGHKSNNKRLERGKRPHVDCLGLKRSRLGGQWGRLDIKWSFVLIGPRGRWA